MKLDYATLISPYPMHLSMVGNVKSPTLEEIFKPPMNYNIYSTFLSLLLSNPEQYCTEINKKELNYWNSISDEEKELLNMFDFIIDDSKLQSSYESVFSFFMEEKVKWDGENKLFITYSDDTDGDLKFVGYITREIFHELCDLILQRCGISKNSEPEKQKFKSKLAQEVWELTHPKEKKEKQNKDIELPNIISSLAAKSESVNMINIWNFTVYQLYDQFRRQQGIAYFNISSMSVAAWGDKENKFDGTAWYKNVFEN